MKALNTSTWTNLAVLLLVPLHTGCGGEDEGAGPLGVAHHEVAAPLASAYCNIQVDGVGSVPTETDYVPHVITCENGGADLEALKAQAIAARSVGYYSMANHGSICDSQGCQVYSCAASPQAKHYQAVEETSGLYLSYDSLLTYGFYVNGDPNTSPPSCVGNPSAPNEHWLTYNEGKTGADVSMTELGYIPPGASIFGQNRGCMGQWGARCLEQNKGYNYEQILKFYYGADIQILQAPGPCVDPIDTPPSGMLDEVTCETIRGWAYDPDDTNIALDVVLYVDSQPGDANPQTFNVFADQYRQDLCDSLGSCSHGFETSFPAELKDNQEHVIRAYAVDPSGGSDVELATSPQLVTCAPSADGGGGTAGLGSGGAPPDGGPAGTGGSVNMAGSFNTDAGSQTRVIDDDDSGCGCTIPGAEPRVGLSHSLLLGLPIWLFLRRRREKIEHAQK